MSQKQFLKFNEFKYPLHSSLEVIDFKGDLEVIERLKEMGLKAGQFIRIEGRAPFGGPILIRMAATVLALRNEEFVCVNLKL